MSFVCVSVFFSFFRFLVKYFQLCIVTSLLPLVVNKAYHTPCNFHGISVEIKVPVLHHMEFHVGPNHVKVSTYRLNEIPCGIFHGITVEHDVFIVILRGQNIWKLHGDCMEFHVKCQFRGVLYSSLFTKIVEKKWNSTGYKTGIAFCKIVHRLYWP